MQGGPAPALSFPQLPLPQVSSGQTNSHIDLPLSGHTHLPDAHLVHVTFAHAHRSPLTDPSRQADAFTLWIL